MWKMFHATHQIWYTINFFLSLPILPFQSHFLPHLTFSFFLSFLSTPTQWPPTVDPILLRYSPSSNSDLRFAHLDPLNMKQQRTKMTSRCGWVAMDGEVHWQWRSGVRWLRWAGVQHASRFRWWGVAWVTAVMVQRRTMPVEACGFEKKWWQRTVAYCSSSWTTVVLAAGWVGVYGGGWHGSLSFF